MVLASRLLSRLRISYSPTPNSRSQRRFQLRRYLGTFQVGDNVILKRIDKPDAAAFLLKALQEGARLQSHKGAFAHNDIIGRRPRDVVKSTSGHAMRLHHATLAEWVTMTARLVTPIYSGEANLIVSLLDIDADPSLYNEDNDRLEILEAGTGHGSLTLHLARAIHAANSHIHRALTDSNHNPLGSCVDHIDPPNIDGRAAVVHTLDVSSTNSMHAKGIISNFRRGVYINDVDFHVGDITKFINEQRAKRQSAKPFLNYVILDLPSAHEELGSVCPLVKIDGSLALYCPQVTQVIDSLRMVRHQGLPLYLDQVVELGANSSAGRQWDVRLVKTRNRKRSHHNHLPSVEGLSGEAKDDDEYSANISNSNDTVGLLDSSPSEVREPASSTFDESEYEIVCRPKYGELIRAGGFLALWKKKTDSKPSRQVDSHME